MRLRITFSKTGALRYTGHLDLHKIWERTLRRAGLPLAYSQGFHPQPKIQIAAALPLGFLGREEIVDVWLAADEAAPPSPESIQPFAPPGLTILRVEAVPERAPALQTQIAAAEYQVTLLETGAGSGLERKAADLLAQDSLPRQRRGKSYDLRPLIQTLECRGTSLYMRLAAGEGATGRPEEVLAELGLDPAKTRIERLRLILKPAIE
ncbi:MAG: TIGR03936 family radical SAM-associated protein [Anaerolineales bacterium]